VLALDPAEEYYTLCGQGQHHQHKAAEFKKLIRIKKGAMSVQEISIRINQLFDEIHCKEIRMAADGSRAEIPNSAENRWVYGKSGNLKKILLAKNKYSVPYINFLI